MMKIEENPRATRAASVSSHASNTVLKQEERERFIHWISPILEEKFGETIRTASNKIAVPIVLENGEEAYIVINVAIPLGEREAKEERSHSASSYDPYIERDNYEMESERKHAKENERMRAENERKREKESERMRAKIAREKRREARAKLREILANEM